MMSKTKKNAALPATFSSYMKLAKASLHKDSPLAAAE